MNSKVKFCIFYEKIWPLSVDIQLNKSNNTLLRAARRVAGIASTAAVGLDENSKRVKSEIVKGEIQNSIRICEK